MLHKIWTFIRHNHTLCAAVISAAIFIAWGYGCESKVPSLDDNTTPVTRVELQAELDKYLATAESRFKNLDRQDEFKEALLNHTIIFAESGTIDPVGLITTIAGILGIGAVIDNRRKDTIIKTQKTAIQNGSANVPNAVQPASQLTGP